MKTRIKATGKIVSVKVVEIGYDYKGRQIVVYEDDKGRRYADNELDFDNPDNTPEDYWTKLEHQYVGMAMQGILSNANHALWDRENNAEGIAKSASAIAHALVEKIKENK